MLAEPETMAVLSSGGVWSIRTAADQLWTEDVGPSPKPSRRPVAVGSNSCKQSGALEIGRASAPDKHVVTMSTYSLSQRKVDQ